MTVRIDDMISDWRPTRWDELAGQEEVTSCLANFCAGRVPMPKALLLSGGHGTGKTTIARVMCMSLACIERDDEDPDPCGDCRECRLVQAHGSSDCVRHLGPDTPQRAHDRILRDMRLYGRFHSASALSVVLADDVDEFAPRRQASIRRLLDNSAISCIVACSARPDRIDQALRSRMSEFVLRLPDLSEAVPEIVKHAKLAALESQDEAEAAEAIFRIAEANWREMWRVLAMMKFAGLPMTPGGVRKAAMRAGMA